VKRTGGEMWEEGYIRELENGSQRRTRHQSAEPRALLLLLGEGMMRSCIQVCSMHCIGDHKPPVTSLSKQIHVFFNLSVVE
jgi:hypothetical protein